MPTGKRFGRWVAVRMINPFAFPIPFYQKSGAQFILWRNCNCPQFTLRASGVTVTSNLIPVTQQMAWRRDGSLPAPREIAFCPPPPPNRLRIGRYAIN